MSWIAMRRIGRSKFNTILSRPRIDISEAYFLNAHMRELISRFQSSPILVFQLCEKNSGGKCEKESPENVLNVPDFWAGEVRKSRSLAIHSKTHFIGVLCPVPYVLTPLRNIGSFIIDSSDLVLEILE